MKTKQAESETDHMGNGSPKDACICEAVVEQLTRAHTMLWAVTKLIAELRTNREHKPVRNYQLFRLSELSLEELGLLLDRFERFSPAQCGVGPCRCKGSVQ